jgi:hypothetical protein
MILLYYTIYSYINIITVWCIYYFLFTVTLHSCIPIPQLIPHTIKFVHRGFTERATFEEYISCAGEGLLYFHLQAIGCYTDRHSFNLIILLVHGAELPRKANSYIVAPP